MSYLLAGGLRSREGFSGNSQPERGCLCGLGTDPYRQLAPADHAHARADFGFTCSAVLGSGPLDCRGVAPRGRVKRAAVQAVLLCESRPLLGYGGDFSARGARKRHYPSAGFPEWNSGEPGVRHPHKTQRDTFFAKSPRAALRYKDGPEFTAWRQSRRQAAEQVRRLAGGQARWDATSRTRGWT